MYNKLKAKQWALALIAPFLLAACSVQATSNSTQANSSQAEVPARIVHETNPIDIEALQEERDLELIYLAGGCFWGVEEYMSRIAGVYDATSGYANGTTDNPSYEDVLHGGTGHAETVRVLYDPEQVSLETLLEKLFLVVDPTSLNQQGNDIGSSYRSGIYYVNENDLPIIEAQMAVLEEEYEEPIVVEVMPLLNFGEAEEYHQDYLKKNTNGYCHIDLDQVGTINEMIMSQNYVVPSEEELETTLTEIQFDVTQRDGTEAPFENEYNDNKEIGLYVDIVTGEPLFTSLDKYDSGTGWPSFTQPIIPEAVDEHEDVGFGMVRTEIRSHVGDSHLGHVFSDGPQEQGGLRYCINSASLRFIPYNEMAIEGYGYLQHLFLEEDTNVYFTDLG